MDLFCWDLIASVLETIHTQRKDKLDVLKIVLQVFVMISSTKRVSILLYLPKYIYF